MRGKWDIIPTGRARRAVRGGRGVVLAALVVIVALALTSGGATPSLPAALSADPPAGVESPASTEGSVAAAPDSELKVAEPPAGRGPTPRSTRPAPNAGDPPTPAGEPPKGEDVPEEWIVQLNDGESADAVAAEHAEEQDAEVHEVYTAALDGYSAHMTDEDALAVASDPRVASVTRDRLFHATAQTTPPGIPRSSAIGIATAVSGAADVNADIAVLDTGIMSNHPDLNYRAGKNCISSSSAPTDNNGHGTHVAGTAAARNNTSEVVGIAPGARVWSVKVLDASGSGTTSQIVCGLNWVAQNASTIEVATMSLGGGGTDRACGSSDAMKNAICNLVNNANIPVTVAAGNEGDNAANHVPAAYDEVITVSAYSDFDGKPGGQASGKCSEQDDTFAYFSNYGADVDITAPGVCILSTKRGGGTTTMSGTSMATPHVAGAVAAYMAKNGKVSPAAVKTALQNAGKDDWTGDRDSFKERSLNLGFLGGTGLVSGGSTPTTTTTPTTTSTSTSTTVAPTTTTTSPGPTTTTTLPPGGSFPLSISKDTYDGGTKSLAKLTWSGAPGTTVTIYRAAGTGPATTAFATTDNDGGWKDNFSSVLAAGTQYTYRVCNGSTCSANITVTF